MASNIANSWMVIQAKDSEYANLEGRSYEYLPRIPNAQRIKPGDLLVITLPKRDTSDIGRIVGLARVGHIARSKNGKFLAHFDRYKALDPPAAFAEIGGDPRRNLNNTINKLKQDLAGRLLQRAGVESVDDLPAVTHEIPEQEIPSGSVLRDELHQAVVDDLLGPAGGPDEEIVGTSVRDRYLVGKIAPKRVTVDPAAAEKRGTDGGKSGEDDEPDEKEAAHESLMPSSFGLTFCVDANIDEISVDVHWGRYERGESELATDKDGAPLRSWKRFPAGGTTKLPLKIGTFDKITPDPERDDVYLKGVVRGTDGTSEKIITLFLVNDQYEPEKSKDVAWLFQPEIKLRATDGSAVFRRRPSGEAKSDDDERVALAMLYRKQVEFAVGHGVGVHWTTAPDKFDRATEIKTSFIPVYDVPRTEIPTVDDIEGIDNLVRDMKVLSELDEAELLKTLRVIPELYAKWIATQDARKEAGEFEEFADSADEALERCFKIKERLEEGISVLEQNEQALEAFRFANKAMWQQRVHGIYTLLRRRGEKPNLEDIDIPKNRSWYPFQLAFVLLGIPSLADPTHSDRTQRGAAIADLLWFPTGGGKTEAYLGLAAFAMAIRRLQGEVAGLDGSRGVSVLMRYTLRLLTIQQFQRASTLICAMEIIRRQDEAKWGRTPFRLGLWVGQRATPNSTKDSCDAIQNAHGDSWVRRGTGSPQQLTNCPWCGLKIDMGKGDLDCRPLAGNVGRTLTFCPAKYGRCEFSRKRSPKEGIPVVVVDEEIYRLAPSMIIATVDKFAQMPWKGQVQTLFGKVTGECLRHGFISPDSESDCSGNHRRTKQLPATTRQDCLQLRPPDLIIQDEFHLISGPLGTMVGLYESAVDDLCSWKSGDVTVHPKVIASTATVRRALEQAHNVFLRRVQIFPAHGLDIEDNFFSIQRKVSEEKPGRRYVGVCAPGMSRPAVLIRVYTAFLTAAQRVRELYGAAADPWMTVVGYFNSLRELGGMRRLVEDDVTTRAFRVSLSDTERPGLAQRDVRAVQELTSRASSTDIPRILDRLEDKFPDFGEDSKRSPIDVVLATNMVSVGVDVQRLGLMVVNGQPKTTAEYIQATSRVGRRHPGLVCTVLNWSRPRDLSHYETFEHYHATFYQHVEAQSVTPFAPRAVDRGLTGVLASMIRLRDFDLNPNPGAGELKKTTHPDAIYAKDRLGLRVCEVVEKDGQQRRDEVMGAIEQRIDEWVNEAEVGNRVLGYKGKKDGSTVGLLKSPGPKPWGTFTTPTSMREVEPPVSLILKTDIAAEPGSWQAQLPKNAGKENKSE